MDYVVAAEFDASAYLAALPELAGHLPPGAARFATDPVVVCADLTATWLRVPRPDDPPPGSWTPVLAIGDRWHWLGHRGRRGPPPSRRPGRGRHGRAPGGPCSCSTRST